MRKLSKRERVLLILLIFLLVAVSYMQFFYLPVGRRLAAAQQRLVIAEEELALGQSQLIRLRQMEKALKEAELSPDFRPVAVPEYDNINLVMLEFDSILLNARDYGLTFVQPRLDEHLAQRSVELTFAAESYAQAKEILSALYDFPYRCELQNITVQPAAASPQGDIAAQPVSVRLTLLLYEKL